MSDVIYSRAQLAIVEETLGAVGSVGEAQAAVRWTDKLAADVSSSIAQVWPFETAWRTQARNDLSNQRAQLQAAAHVLDSADLGGEVGTVWPSLRGLCLNLWAYASIVQGQFPPTELGADRVAQIFADSTDNLVAGVAGAPRAIGAAVGGAISMVAEDVGQPLVNSLRDLLKPLLDALQGPLKWVVIGGAVVVAGGVVYLYARKGAA